MTSFERCCAVADRGDNLAINRAKLIGFAPEKRRFPQLRFTLALLMMHRVLLSWNRRFEFIMFLLRCLQGLRRMRDGSYRLLPQFAWLFFRLDRPWVYLVTHASLLKELRLSARRFVKRLFILWNVRNWAGALNPIVKLIRSGLVGLGD